MLALPRSKERFSSGSWARAEGEQSAVLAAMVDKRVERENFILKELIGVVILLCLLLSDLRKSVFVR